MNRVSLSYRLAFSFILLLKTAVVVSAQGAPGINSTATSLIATQQPIDRAPHDQPPTTTTISLDARIKRLPNDLWKTVSFDTAKNADAGVTDRPTDSTTFEAVQQAEQAPPPRRFVLALLHNMVDDVKHIPRRNTVYWLAGGAALTAAVHPFDDSLNARLVGSDTADTAFKPGHIIGSTPVQLGATAVTYLVGAIGDKPRVRHLGMDLLEAQLLSEGITQVIKVIVRRERPDNSGFGFPSGHAAITMASATVLQQHLGWKAAVPTYAIATYVSVSRLHDNRHFASDVVAGMTEGIIIGRAVTWHGRNTWAMVPSVGRGEAAIYISHR